MKTIFRNSVLHKTVELNEIEDYYRRHFDYSIVKYAEENHDGLTQFEVNKCLDTGALFSTPRSFYGTKDYYVSITKSATYYKSARWEWLEALTYLKPSMSVLDVGCGNRSFMKLAQGNVAEIKGLELSDHLSDDGFKVFDETLEQHCETNASGAYDAIVSFHVLEHLPDVSGFLAAAKLQLKKSGLLVIAVPDNSSFIAKDRANILNMPPHHVNWWHPQSITKTLIFSGFDVKQVIVRPLNPNCYNWYCQTLYDRLESRLGIVGRVLYRLVRPAALLLLRYRVLSPSSAEMLIVAESS